MGSIEILAPPKSVDQRRGSCKMTHGLGYRRLACIGDSDRFHSLGFYSDLGVSPSPQSRLKHGSDQAGNADCTDYPEGRHESPAVRKQLNAVICMLYA